MTARTFRRGCGPRDDLLDQSVPPVPVPLRGSYGPELLDVAGLDGFRAFWLPFRVSVDVSRAERRLRRAMTPDEALRVRALWLAPDDFPELLTYQPVRLFERGYDRAGRQVRPRSDDPCAHEALRTALTAAYGAALRRGMTFGGALTAFAEIAADVQRVPRIAPLPSDLLTRAVWMLSTLLFIVRRPTPTAAATWAAVRARAPHPNAE